MAFTDFPEQQDVVQLLQRSLERGRLGHAYLFNGVDIGELEAVARTLAKTLNCERPVRRTAAGLPLDSCDACLNCRKISEETHPDVMWLRPESKSRIIRVEQIRELIRIVYLKPTQAPVKVAVLVEADRLKTEGANAFLKTLEEPPADSVLILLSTDPQRLLETILSRCLRLNFSGEGGRHRDPALLSWLGQFTDLVAAEQKSLLGRYRLLAALIRRLTEMRAGIEERLGKQSPLERYEDVERNLREKWEDELTAAVEAEYRRQRGDVLAGLQAWLRDVWLETMKCGEGLSLFPDFVAIARQVARRLTPDQAMENLRQLDQLQRLLAVSNVQESLALEVGLLRLKL